jgi:riboflavin kinase / FMN adenylyltransferase
MQIFRRCAHMPARFQDAVLAAGDFDGLHLQHREAILEARRMADSGGRPLAVATFGSPAFALTPLRVQARLLAGLGVDLFMAPPPGAQDKLKAGAAITSGSGDAALSDRIRAALTEARPGEAAALMARYWAIEARVRHGDKRGRAMSFPTANMRLDRYFAPALGIYAVRAAILDRGRIIARHDGVASFGHRPMYRAETPLLETHLFDFQGDLYGRHLSVELVAWLRPEENFSSMPALVAQMHDDAAAARAVLAAAPHFGDWAAP